MNKAELIIAVAGKTGMSRKDTEKVIDTALDTMIETLGSGEKVQLVGFGIFGVKERAARMGRNPKTREEIEIPVSRGTFFRPGKLLKDALSK